MSSTGKLEVGALPDSLSANLYLGSGSAIGSQDCVTAGGSPISLAQGSSFCVTSMYHRFTSRPYAPCLLLWELRADQHVVSHEIAESELV